MKIKALKQFFAESAKRLNIKNVNVTLNRNGMIVESDSTNKIQFVHKFNNIVMSKMVSEGFKIKERKDSLNDDNFIRAYEFDNANIVTDDDGENLILPSVKDGDYEFDGNHYRDDELLDRMDNMTDEEYGDYVLYSDLHDTDNCKSFDLCDDDNNICFTISVYDPEIDDSVYEDENNFDDDSFFDPIYTNEDSFGESEVSKRYIAEDNDEIEDDTIFDDETKDMVTEVGENEFKEFKKFCKSDKFDTEKIKEFAIKDKEIEDDETLDNDSKEAIVDAILSVYDWEDKGWVERDTFIIEPNAENTDDTFENFLAFVEDNGGAEGNIECGVVDLFVDEYDVDEEPKELLDDWINNGLVSIDSFKFIEDEDVEEYSDDEEDEEEIDERKQWKESRDFVRKFKRVKAIRESRKERDEGFKGNKYKRSFRNR